MKQALLLLGGLFALAVPLGAGLGLHQESAPATPTSPSPQRVASDAPKPRETPFRRQLLPQEPSRPITRDSASAEADKLAESAPAWKVIFRKTLLEAGWEKDAVESVGA